MGFGRGALLWLIGVPLRDPTPCQLRTGPPDALGAVSNRLARRLPARQWRRRHERDPHGLHVFEQYFVLLLEAPGTALGEARARGEKGTMAVAPRALRR